MNKLDICRIMCYFSFKMNEPELIKRCLAKDKKAWNLFIEKYSRLIYWAIRRRLIVSGFQYNEADVDDIFQEVFAALFEGEKLSYIKEIKSVSGWLVMFASNKTTDIMLKRCRLGESLGLEETLLNNGQNLKELLNRDIADLVKEAISNLSDKERIVISLNILEGKSHKDISFMLNMPINTVSTIISRTKEKLTAALEKMGMLDYL